MYQFDYIITEYDYLKFSINHSLYSKSGRQYAVLLKICVPILFATPIFDALIYESPTLIPQIIVCTIMSVLWIVFFKKFIAYNARKKMRKMQKSGRLPYNENGTLIFGEDYIYDKSGSLRSQTPYNVIQAIFTADGAFYIYNSATTAFILPGRFIEDQVMFRGFSNFLQEKTGKTIINIAK